MTEAVEQGECIYIVEGGKRIPKLQAAYAKRTAAAEAARIVYTLRSRAGLTQKALAEMIGTKQSMIARLENNVPKLGPTFETLAQIMKACGYKVTLRFEEMSDLERTASMAPQIETEYSEVFADDDAE